MTHPVANDYCALIALATTLGHTVFAILMLPPNTWQTVHKSAGLARVMTVC